jgi:hypothetical protein
VEDLENKFPATQEERKKNHAAYNREKKIHAKESAKKSSGSQAFKILHF